MKKPKKSRSNAPSPSRGGPAARRQARPSPRAQGRRPHRSTAPRPPRLDVIDAVVLEVYGLVHDQGWLADRALERALRRERKMWAVERRQAAESLYGLLRMQGQIDFLLSGHAPGDTARGLDLATRYAGWLVRFGGTTAVEAAARLGVSAGTLKGLVDADRQIARIPDAHLRLAVEGSLPPWIVGRLVAERGEEEARQLVQVMNQRAPLTVRTNALKGDREALRARLEREGVRSEPTRFSPWGLTLDGHQNAFMLASFQEGWFEIQDEGSQLIALACGARPGKVVVDACAGAGGKTLALAAEMHNKGTLWALDSDAGRLDEADVGRGALAWTICGPSPSQRAPRLPRPSRSFPPRRWFCWWTRPVVDWVLCAASPMPAGGSDPKIHLASLPCSASCWVGLPHWWRRGAGWSTPPAPWAGPRTPMWPSSQNGSWGFCLHRWQRPWAPTAPLPWEFATTRWSSSPTGMEPTASSSQRSFEGSEVPAWSSLRFRPYSGLHSCPSSPRSSSLPAAFEAGPSANGLWGSTPIRGPAASFGRRLLPPSRAPCLGAKVREVRRRGKHLLVTLERAGALVGLGFPPWNDRQVAPFHPRGGRSRLPTCAPASSWKTAASSTTRILAYSVGYVLSGTPGSRRRPTPDPDRTR